MKELLEIVYIFYVKLVATPLYMKLLSKVDGNVLTNPSKYQRLVRLLQYLTLTWLDIAFGVNKLFQFMELPIDLHILIAKRLLRCHWYIAVWACFAQMWGVGLNRVLWC